LTRGAGTEAQWENALNHAWTALSPKQRIELRQSERDWIKWRDSLPAEDSLAATRDRTTYLEVYKKMGPAAADSSEYNDKVDKLEDPTLLPVPTKPPSSTAEVAVVTPEQLEKLAQESDVDWYFRMGHDTYPRSKIEHMDPDFLHQIHKTWLDKLTHKVQANEYIDPRFAFDYLNYE
jgi:hypothetical protein